MRQGTRGHGDSWPVKPWCRGNVWQKEQERGADGGSCGPGEKGKTGRAAALAPRDSPGPGSGF